MNVINLAPFYCNTIGFDRFAALLDSPLKADHSGASAYLPYNIEVIDENEYATTLAVAGFSDSELDINVEKGMLTVSGSKEKEAEHKYLHQGIANRTFERKFNLADYVEVTDADLNNGLLTIHLVREIPEAAKPKSIAIKQDKKAIEHSSKESTKSFFHSIFSKN